MDLIQLSSLRKKLHKRVFSLILADMTQKMQRGRIERTCGSGSSKEQSLDLNTARNELT